MVPVRECLAVMNPHTVMVIGNRKRIDGIEVPVRRMSVHDYSSSQHHQRRWKLVLPERGNAHGAGHDVDLGATGAAIAVGQLLCLCGFSSKP